MTEMSQVNSPPTRRPLSRTLRYLAPNVVTCLSMLCAVFAMQAALRGEIIVACWWVAYSTLTDKLDGIVARALKASSPLGVQMDSLADLLNYGFCPAAITYGFFYSHPQLGWTQGLSHYGLAAICAAYMLCAAIRLARFNISEGSPDFFFGVPTTFCGAIAVVGMVTICKYGDPAWTPGQGYPGWRLFGDVRLDDYVKYYPLLLVLLGYLMVSSWRVPKAGKIRNKLLNQFCLANMIFGYAAAMLQRLPEYLIVAASLYILVAIYCHYFLTPPVKPDPVFPA
jgi:CDP-diacylglycerol--serine O-phosphatidyltransferase